MKVDNEPRIAALVKAVSERHRQKRPLNIPAVKRERPELIKEAFAIRPFIGWRGLLELADIDYDGIVVYLQDTVSCPICGFEASFIATHITRKHNRTIDEFRLDYPDAELISESSRALRSKMEPAQIEVPEGGIVSVPHWEDIWTLEYCLDRVWAYYQLGMAIHPRNLTRMEAALRAKIFEYHRKTSEFYLRLGLDPEAVQRQPSRLSYTRESLMEIVKSRVERGESLRTKSLRSAYPGFSYAVNLHFGNIEDLFDACGLTIYEFGNERFTEADRQRLHDDLKSLHADGNSGAKITAFKRTHHYHCKAFYDGRWDRAAVAAGIEPEFVAHAPDPETLLDRRDPEADNRYLYPTAESVMEGMKRRMAEGLSNRATALQRARQAGGDSALYDAAVRYFGSLDEARKAVGLAPYTHAKVRYRHEFDTHMPLKRRRQKPSE